MDHREQGEDHATPLVVAHVLVQRDKLVDTKPPKKEPRLHFIFIIYAKMDLNKVMSGLHISKIRKKKQRLIPWPQALATIRR